MQALCQIGLTINWREKNRIKLILFNSLHLVLSSRSFVLWDNNYFRCPFYTYVLSFDKDVALSSYFIKLSINTKFSFSDINECSSRSLNGCGPGATCVNRVPGYTCECPSGFKGDGRVGCEPAEVRTGKKILYVIVFQSDFNKAGSFPGTECTQKLPRNIWLK